MAPHVLLDLPVPLHVILTLATALVGGLTILFSLSFLGGRVLRRRTVQARVRAGIGSAMLVIVLAVLDIWLKFFHS